MTIRDLIDQLEDIESEYDNEGIPVSIAIQQSYPLECRIQNIRLVDGTLYIAAGEAHGYIDGRAWTDSEEDDQ